MHSKRKFPAETSGTDKVQKKHDSSGTGIGGGGKVNMAAKTKSASSIPGSGK